MDKILNEELDWIVEETHSMTIANDLRISKENIKKAIYDLTEELIGGNEHHSINKLHSEVETRNQLRQELRTKREEMLK